MLCSFTNFLYIYIQLEYIVIDMFGYSIYCINSVKNKDIKYVFAVTIHAFLYIILFVIMFSSLILLMAVENSVENVKNPYFCVSKNFF